MKISTKGRYALEAVLDLALHSEESHESLKNIGERLDISENYLEQIFITLKKKKITESIRGAQGGYRIAGDIKKITAGDVIRAAEGQFAPVSCVREGKEKCSCGMHNNCVAKSVWEKMMNELNAIADSVTIYDLMRSYEEMERNHTSEYYI